MTGSTSSFPAKTPAEEAYNKAHNATFSVMTRALARWKRRFPSLETGLDIRSEILDSVIIATAVLHNIAMRRGEPEPPASGAPPLEQPPPSEQIPATYRGDQARKQIIQSMTLGGAKWTGDLRLWRINTREETPKEREPTYY